MELFCLRNMGRRATEHSSIWNKTCARIAPRAAPWLSEFSGRKLSRIPAGPGRLNCKDVQAQDAMEISVLIDEAYPCHPRTGARSGRHHGARQPSPRFLGDHLDLPAYRRRETGAAAGSGIRRALPLNRRAFIRSIRGGKSQLWTCSI